MTELTCPSRSRIHTVCDIDAELEPHEEFHIVHVPVIRKIQIKQMRAALQAVKDTDPAKPLVCVTPVSNTQIMRLCPLLWLKKLFRKHIDELGECQVWLFEPPRS